jgi:hypothetical protein
MRIGRTQSERYTEFFARTGYLPMAIEKLTTLRGISIRPIKRTDVNGLVQLHMEFEKYLKAIDKSRPQQARNNYRGSMMDSVGPARSEGLLPAETACLSDMSSAIRDMIQMK